MWAVSSSIDFGRVARTKQISQNKRTIEDQRDFGLGKADFKVAKDMDDVEKTVEREDHEHEGQGEGIGEAVEEVRYLSRV